MSQYISSRGASMAPEGMDKKYLVNALIDNVKQVACAGRNVNAQTLLNVEILKAEIIRRLTKTK